MSEAEAAYADALARIKAATAGDSVDALAVHAARADLAAAKKALNSSGKVKKKRANTYKKVSPAGSGEAAPAATAAAVCQLPRQPARLPGFGSQEYWDAQPDNPAWQHYPAHITIPTESTSGFITNEADNGHGSTVASASAPSSTSASQIGVCKDAGAEQWTKSFDVDDSAAALQFWEDYGFVIFRDVLTLEVRALCAVRCALCGVCCVHFAAIRRRNRMCAAWWLKLNHPRPPAPPPILCIPTPTPLPCEGM